MPPDELTLAKALEMLEQASVGEEPLGICPDTHKPVFLKQGRFGPYVQLARRRTRTRRTRRCCRA